MLASYGGKTVCHALLGVYVSSISTFLFRLSSLADFLFFSPSLHFLQMLMSNRKRDRLGPADPKRAADLGMQGKTEDENPDFRYVL